jgi:Tfp pilus assembly protein PilO
MYTNKKPIHTQPHKHESTWHTASKIMVIINAIYMIVATVFLIWFVVRNHDVDEQNNRIESQLNSVYTTVTIMNATLATMQTQITTIYNTIAPTNTVLAEIYNCTCGP